MVQFVELCETSINDPSILPNLVDKAAAAAAPTLLVHDKNPLRDLHDESRPNPNINAFSAALGCYPIVCQIAQHLDLNSLHDLSLACRQFRANLLQFRSQLVKQTLRCNNEVQDSGFGSTLGERLRESHQAWTGIGANGRSYTSRISSGKVGRCARDMVGECRRCGVIVCRNCTSKSPSAKALTGRHRRLCRTCIRAPLRCHATSLNDSYAAGPPTPDHPFDSENAHARSYRASFTAVAFSRSPCTCEDHVYLCLSCGNAMRSADTTYMRGWTWRTRYSTYLGGLGTGIGEGNEGVTCGRGADCLAAREVENEIDCDAEELADMRRLDERIQGEGRQWSGASYMVQEMEGIGGVVKKKVKRRVKIGVVVKEYEDERESGEYLAREQTGQNRSWCAWCERIIPGSKDRKVEGEREGEGDSGQTSSGASSVAD